MKNDLKKETDATDAFIQGVCEGTMRAAANNIRVKEIRVDLGKVSENIRTVIKMNYSGMMESLQDALRVHAPNSQLKQLVNVECNLMGIKAVKMAMGQN